MVVAALFILGGFTLLVFGGTYLVTGSVNIARSFAIRPAIISVTVVAFGTSVPEMAVSVIAAVKGSGDIAAANVVGSNIANIALVLGATACVMAVPARGTILKLEWPIMIFSALLLYLVFQSGDISRIEGAILMTGAVLFTAFMAWVASKERKDARGRIESADTVQSLGPENRATAMEYVRVFGGILLLIAGGELALRGAVGLAREAGLTERVIGLTIVAIGTSLPEIATSVIASLKGEHEVGLGNIIGSNIYNTLSVLGAAALVLPVGVSAGLINFDIWIMVGFSLLIFPMMFFTSSIPRWGGGLLLAGWLTYTGYLYLHG